MVQRRLGCEVELVEIATDGDRTQAAGTPIERAAAPASSSRAARRAPRRPRRRRRALAQGPPHPPAPGIALAASRSARTRATSSWPATGSRSASSGRQPGRYRVPEASGTAPRPRPRFGRGRRSWERRHPDQQGARRSVRRRGARAAGLARLGQVGEATEVLDPLQIFQPPGRVPWRSSARTVPSGATRRRPRCARRPAHAGRGRVRASGPGHPRRRVLGTDRSPGGGRRG